MRKWSCRPSRTATPCPSPYPRFAPCELLPYCRQSVAKKTSEELPKQTACQQQLQKHARKESLETAVPSRPTSTKTLSYLKNPAPLRLHPTRHSKTLSERSTQQQHEEKHHSESSRNISKDLRTRMTANASRHQHQSNPPVHDLQEVKFKKLSKYSRQRSKAKIPQWNCIYFPAAAMSLAAFSRTSSSPPTM